MWLAMLTSPPLCYARLSVQPNVNCDATLSLLQLGSILDVQQHCTSCLFCCCFFLFILMFFFLLLFVSHCVSHNTAPCSSSRNCSGLMENCCSKDYIFFFLSKVIFYDISFECIVHKVKLISFLSDKIVLIYIQTNAIRHLIQFQQWPEGGSTHKLV